MIFFKSIIHIFLLLSIISCNAKTINVVTKMNYSYMQHTSISFKSNRIFSKETSVGFDEKILKIISQKEIKNIEKKLHNILAKNHPYEAISYVLMKGNIHYFLAKNKNKPTEGLNFRISNISDSNLAKKMLTKPIQILTSVLEIMELKSNSHI